MDSFEFGFTICLNSRNLRIMQVVCDFVCVCICVLFIFLFTLSFAVKPEAPFGLNVTYQEKANEYLVQYSTPHIEYAFLEDKLIHQLAYRQKNASWTVSKND